MANKLKKGGKRISTYEDGSPWVECRFKKGKPDGYYREWRRGGGLSVEKVFVEDEVRILRHWSAGGVMISEAFYYPERHAFEIKKWNKSSKTYKVSYRLNGKRVSVSQYHKAISAS